MPIVAPCKGNIFARFGDRLFKAGHHILGGIIVKKWLLGWFFIAVTASYANHGNPPLKIGPFMTAELCWGAWGKYQYEIDQLGDNLTRLTSCFDDGQP